MLGPFRDHALALGTVDRPGGVAELITSVLSGLHR
jgi:hypothetical protein